jgi:hypothetical protein
MLTERWTKNKSHIAVFWTWQNETNVSEENSTSIFKEKLKTK